MPIPNINIHPSSPIGNSHGARPRQVLECNHSINSRLPFLLSCQVDRNILPRFVHSPIGRSSESHPFVGLIFTNAFQSLDNGILVIQFIDSILPILSFKGRVNVVCCSALLEDVGGKMHPVVGSSQLCHFWNFHLLLKLHTPILFIGFVDALGNNFTRMRDARNHAFQLRITSRCTKCFYLPSNFTSPSTGASNSPENTYLNSLEALTCPGLTKGSSFHCPSTLLLTQYE